MSQAKLPKSLEQATQEFALGITQAIVALCVSIAALLGVAFAHFGAPPQAVLQIAGIGIIALFFAWILSKGIQQKNLYWALLIGAILGLLSGVATWFLYRLIA